MSAVEQPSTAAQFGALDRPTVLLGLGPVQVGFVGVAVLIAVSAVYTTGAAGFAASALLWGPLLAVGTISVKGRPVVEWIPLVASWQVRSLSGRTRALTQPTTTARPSELVLPGIAGRLRVLTSPAGTAMIADRRSGTVTAIARVSSTGFVLDDPQTQDRKSTGWGRVLGMVCQQPQVVRVQVLNRTAPGGAGTARAWWRAHTSETAPWAARLLADLMDHAADECDTNECLIAISTRTTRNVAGRTRTDQGAALDQLATSLSSALGAADLHVTAWVTPADLGAVIRRAYDPAGTATADDTDPTLTHRLLGPMGVQEHWDHLVTDTAVHATYWVAQWPRSPMHQTFLQPLILAPGSHRTVTLIAEPMPAARALREIRRAKVEYLADAGHRAKVGQIEDETANAAYAEVLRREQDLISGHGDYRFTGLITVTAPTAGDLETACGATETAAAQAMCELRRLVGQQGQAHLAAALPLARGLL
ncbi:hypothetical protein SAMN05216410_2987 [Sanguibacter gelidistatuariae]|uniref:PrgI family protein n=1 Tax=Sanguibacter gelidistatuariae TaxID=1814289 RepID=A0A1G6T0L5_9MICO|nr:SCO6880 family protein [Sanguibacter gelidistatuariae]SDD22501.1 hypothetical protein SAMN05216410_2987 [Sanguibacter gelidistatuariae]